ncbi:hypothetical protein H4I95_11489 [Botrytis cinerea]
MIIKTQINPPTPTTAPFHHHHHPLLLLPPFSPNPSLSQIYPRSIPSISRPPDTFLVELLTYNGHPYKDHWAYFIRSPSNPSVGVRLHATGDVRNGFRFEIQLDYNLYTTEDIPTKRISLQWVDGGKIPNEGLCEADVDMYNRAICSFEESVRRAEVPGKTLNSLGEENHLGKKIIQKDCQSWLVEAADHLVQDGIFDPEVAGFLHAVKQ